MGKLTLIIMIITLISNLLGFIRDISLSYFFGASKITDAFFVAYAIPTILFGVIGYALSTGYIPIFNYVKQNLNKKKSELFTSNVINIFIVINMILVVFFMVFTEELVNLFASGFPQDTFNLTVSFVKISVWSVIFLGIINILKGYLQVHEKIIVTTSIGIPLNIVMLLFIYFASISSISFLPLGILIGTIAQLIFLIPVLSKLRFTYSKYLHLRDPNLLSLVKNMLPLIFGVSVFHINTAISMTLASRTMEGGVSILNYAQRINGLIEGLFIISVITIVFPKIVVKIQDKNRIGAEKILDSSIRILIFFILPAMTGIIFLSEPIVIMMFGRGAFELKDVLATSETVFFFVIGTLGYGIREMLARVFYSFQDTVTPMYNSIVTIFINIILSLILVQTMGISGIALGTSIASILSAIFLTIGLKKKWEINYVNKNLVIYSLKVLFISLTMGWLVKSLFDYLTYSLYISLSISIAVGVIFYLTISFVLDTNKINYFD